ncbi:hypothetical protein K488DRAFT_85680 [Vararia minispora EC-137]|uniref:Uncharacterized protein n=1 Tax=Vararia minispora EC-137 TaxID=1314806 RepID=A0ACB8QLD5_9AGAM|nr:hypothetical protein K488DRAFT_85680 [Vararia minispora EC-137]
MSPVSGLSSRAALGDPEAQLKLSGPSRRPCADHLRLKFPGTRQPFRAIIEKTFAFLCLVAYGEKDLHDIWEVAHRDTCSRTEWLEQIKPLTDRLATICILAGLLVSTTAAFITTTPPVPSMFDYTVEGIYGCLLCSFAIILGGLAVGTIILFIMTKCDQDWFRQMHLSSRSRIICLTVILAYPFISIMAGIVLGALSLCVAILITASTAFRVISVLVAGGPFAMLCLFLWMQVPNQTRHRRAGEEMSDEAETTLQGASTTGVSGFPMPVLAQDTTP